jgi:hypothetical protein
MRKSILFTTALLAACSQPQSSREDQSTKAYDVEREAPEPALNRPMIPPPTAAAALRAENAADQGGGPNVGVTAAPGVAFNYRYAFRLPNARIQATQEAHAAMCEKLGIARCRITGMRYALVNEKDISASLEIKLDPAIARQFGKDATKVVSQAEGMLIDQEINGVDAGSSIQKANSSRAALQDELDGVNRELARAGLSNVVRDRLLSEAASLRSQIRALSDQKDADEESLAKTPMVFYYGSGKAIPGFDEPAPLQYAFNRAGYNFLSALGFLVIAIATLLPWVLIATLAVWGYRRLPARWRLFRPKEDRPVEA